jgi:hypothetical protein
MSTKEVLLEVAEKLPPEAMLVDAIYELEFRQAVTDGRIRESLGGAPTFLSACSCGRAWSTWKHADKNVSAPPDSQRLANAPVSTGPERKSLANLLLALIEGEEGTGTKGPGRGEVPQIESSVALAPSNTLLRQVWLDALS